MRLKNNYHSHICAIFRVHNKVINRRKGGNSDDVNISSCDWVGFILHV